MLRVQFEIQSSDYAEACDFNTGAMRLITENGLISEGTSLMIIPSITLLLDQVRSFLSSNQSLLRYAGVDGCYRLTIEKGAGEEINIRGTNTSPVRLQKECFIKAIWIGVQEFSNNNSEILNRCAVIDDFNMAMRDFKLQFAL